MLALITGTALHDIVSSDSLIHQTNVHTPFGRPSSPVEKVRLGTAEILVMARHGLEGSIGAHEVNYRANLWALKECGATRIVASATVGAIRGGLNPGDFVVPDQVIDYTYGREQTYVGFTELNHFDFTFPFTDELRQQILSTLPSDQREDINLRGVYGCTQGPRLETAAEIRRLERDGCDLAGMTLMPEASLARELALDYAAICLVVNPAAGVDGKSISFEEIEEVTKIAVIRLKEQLEVLVQLVN